MEVAAGSSVTLNVLDNDTDPDGDALLLDPIGADVGIAHVGSDRPGDVHGAERHDRQRDRRALHGPRQLRRHGRGHGDGQGAVEGFEQRAGGGERLAGDGRRSSDHVQRADQRLRSGQRPVVDRRVCWRPATTPSSPWRRRRCRPTGSSSSRRRSPASTCSSIASTDGSEEDRAIIRVDVSAEQENRPPTAIRDDVTIARGGDEDGVRVDQRHRSRR